MSDAFQPGDVVRLKSGGPLMTVSINGDGEVGVGWFDGNALKEGFFDPAQLVKVDSPCINETPTTIFASVEPVVAGSDLAEIARRTRLAVQHAVEKYCVGRDAVTVLEDEWDRATRLCPCTQKVRLQLVRDLDGFAYARGRCTECNRVYVAVEPVA